MTNPDAAATSTATERVFVEHVVDADDFVRLLRLTAGAVESSPLWWHRGRNGHRWHPTDERPNPPRSFTHMSVSAPCSDVFWWGSADAEEIGPDHVDAYGDAIADVQAALSALRDVDARPGFDSVLAYAGWLYAARSRNERPQGAMYPAIPGALWSLFDAAGPTRETGLGNPKPRPSAPEPITYPAPECLHVHRLTPAPAWTPAELVTLFGACSFDSQQLLRWDVSPDDDRLRVYVVNGWAETPAGADCTVGTEIAPAHTEALIAAIELERVTHTRRDGSTFRMEGEPPNIVARFSALTGLRPARSADFHNEASEA